MKRYLVGALSTNMLPGDCTLHVRCITPHQAAPLIVDSEAHVGHGDAADLIEREFDLDRSVYSRSSIKVDVGDELVVAQFNRAFRWMRGTYRSVMTYWHVVVQAPQG
jgi:hypothetical protein